MLNTGFKQESGQFFTPVPLVRFIIKSLPIQNIIQDKIKENEKDFLPYIIDFACGSGHFLTEAMDVLQEKINKIDENSLNTSQKRKLTHHKSGDFEWAKEFVYGIERDYRLVKTTKLSCFLHGDGEAQIIHANGLDPFTSEEYKNKLRIDKVSEDNPVFDLLIANPPYSVSGFRSTVKSKKAFSLYPSISDQSSEIEVLFIERMKQLLKPGAFAAIILPSSILSNGGNYERARKLILEHFMLKAILSLGSGAFMATGTNTVVLFLQKREKPISLTTKEEHQNELKGEHLLVIQSGEKDKEKDFLGYEFSNRRGSEGIKKRGEGRLLNEEEPHKTQPRPKAIYCRIYQAKRWARLMKA